MEVRTLLKARSQQSIAIWIGVPCKDSKAAYHLLGDPCTLAPRLHKHLSGIKAWLCTSC
jgi:hypothetical protein